MTGIALIVAILFFILGLAGTILPVLPGAILIYIGMIIYGFMTNFTTLTLEFYILQGLALIIIIAIDFVASAAGTKRFGGSRAAAWGAVLGTIVSLFFLGPFGLLLGPFAGAVAVELLISKKPLEQAIRAGFGTDRKSTRLNSSH